MDITLRRLADQIYIVRRSLIPFPNLFLTKRIAVKIGIDDQTHQITDQYFFQFLGIRYFLGSCYWNMFDSWSAPALASRSWRSDCLGLVSAPEDKKSLVAQFKALRRDRSFLRKLRNKFQKKDVSNDVELDSFPSSESVCSPEGDVDEWSIN